MPRLTWKWLQICTDMATSTGDELFRNANIDNFQWPWTPKIWGFSEFFGDFGLRHAFQEWIAPKWLETDQHNLRMKFSALNVDYSSPSSDLLYSKRPAHAGVKQGTLLKSGYFSAVVLSIAWKWLQIGTDMMLIITSTSDELLRNVSIDDFEWPWILKVLILSYFWQFLAAKEWIATKWIEIDQDYLRTGTAICSCASHEH